MKKINIHYFYIALICIPLISLITGFYFQYVKDLIPCSLCLLQRFAYFGTLLFILFNYILYLLKFKRYYLFETSSIFSCFFIFLGIILAGRQTYLQLLPEKLKPTCGIDLEGMLNMDVPLIEALIRTFKGSGSCATIDYTIMNLSIANISLIIFVLLIIIKFYLLFKLSRVVNS